MTGQEFGDGGTAPVEAGSTGLLPSVVAALAGAGLTVEEYARQHYYEDGWWGGDRCGCPDDRCIGFHHFGQDDCGCFPVVLDMALNEQAQARLSAQDAEAQAYQAVADEERSHRAWQASGELSAQATAEAAEMDGLESAVELGEAGPEAGL